MATPTKTNTKAPTALKANVLAAEIKRLDALIDAQEKARQELHAAPQALINSPWPLIARKIRLLSAQSWGPRVEAWLINHHGWEPVQKTLSRGDARRQSGTKKAYIEIKASLITATNQKANFVQIRPHHKVDEYHLFVIETDHTLIHLALTPAQMKRELERHGYISHGTKAKNAANPTAEWDLRIPWSKTSPQRTHFIEHYRVGANGSGTHCC